MSFPVPTKYNLTDDKNQTVVVYNDGREKELLPWVDGTSDGGGSEPEPTDGKTHIWIHIDHDTPVNRLTFTLYFGQSVANGVTVDWGDGSATETFADTGTAVHEHTYATGGDYEITLEVTNGTLNLTGTSSSSGYAIYGSKANSNSYNRSRIRRVHIADGVTSIGANAFYNCYSLTNLTIPNSVTSIGDNAFGYCYSLTNLTIPDGVTSIGANAFASCYSITNLTIADGVTSIGSSAFYHCYSLTNLTIADGVTSIGSNAFDSCYSLTNLTIPNSVTSIGVSAFASCYSITNLTIPDGVTSIGASAFASCYSITNLTIPDGVTSIGASAFANCHGISEYHFLPAIPPTLTNANAFNGIANDCVIFVPVGSLEAYQTASNWSTYASHMQEEAS